jgi:RNA polymerase sigma-70 factor (ECF subfamily)
LPGLNSPWDHSPDPLAALREGDPEPFEAFVRAALGRFLGFFRRQGASLEEAEDLTQEVFLKLHQNADRYRPEERFPSYCFRVARNVWIDARRRGAARPTPTSLDAGGAGGPAGDGRSLGERNASEQREPGDVAALREGAERLRAAVSELGEHHRLVFELGVVQELSYGEIGSILDIPVGTVKSRMFHAVRKLREAAGTDSADSAARPAPDAGPRGTAR